jgi:hypothetical protein
MAADRRLGRRSEDRLGETRPVDQAARQRHSAHPAGVAVVEQPRAGEVAAGDALYWDHLESLTDERPTGQLGRCPLRQLA